MQLLPDDMRLTWGEYRPIAPHVFRCFDAKGNKHFVLSAEKTHELLRLNLTRLLMAQESEG
jgi:hypothetical protein